MQILISDAEGVNNLMNFVKVRRSAAEKEH